jgi:hypothetical protein
MDNYDKICEAGRLAWTPKIGDRFVVKHSLYVGDIGDENIGFTTKKQKYQRPYYEEGIEYVVGEEGFGAILSHDMWIYAEESLKPFAIWLPSVEQISETFLKKLGALEPIIHGFFVFIMKREFGSLIKYYSYRELHLIYFFYYFENKLWNGEEFIEIEESIEKRWGG